MKICLVISSLRSGGAERVIALLANHWSATGHVVHVITMESSDSDFYRLTSDVKRHSLSLNSKSLTPIQAVASNIRRIHTIRKSIRHIKPDVVLSFMDAMNILCSLALIGSRIPLVVSERIDPFMQPIGLLRTAIRPWLYRTVASALVAQTDSVKTKCQKIWRIRNVQVIANPFSPPDMSGENVRSKVVLSVGRLNPQKGHDTLIRAFQKVSQEFPDWKLLIVGEGGQRNFLEKIIGRLEVRERISMPGLSGDVFKHYKDSAIFCLPSRFEGFPNALLEALAMGCACIATDCESGPREILENGRFGILTPVDDVDAMADALRKLMQDSELRRKYGAHSDYVRSRYKLESISQQWLDLFDQVKK